MYVEQFFIAGLAHSSYILGSDGVCAIIDPRRDVGVYLAAAKERNLKITHILETHLHADFISGHLDLADMTGADIYAPAEGGCAFEHQAVGGGDSFTIGALRIDVLDTPGHTPEHITFVVTDTSRGESPAAVFCGDTLFVGDVGRPDLFPGRAGELAEKLFTSLHEKLLALPDYVEVYPAHGAGSLCGRAMSEKRTSTLGYERLFNPSLQQSTLEEFKEYILSGMPSAPDHFRRCSATNARGPARVSTLPRPQPMDVSEFEALRGQGHLVVDVRKQGSFGSRHVPGAFNIPLAGNFSTFSGWLLPPDERILLVVEQPGQVEEAVIQLRRVGIDLVAGWLEEGMAAWEESGMEVEHVAQASAKILKHRLDGTAPPLVIDVRTPTEFATGHVPGALNIPLPDTRTKVDHLERDQSVALICASGARSGMAAGILKRQGFADVWNVSGGTSGWANLGFPLEKPEEWVECPDSCHRFGLTCHENPKVCPARFM